MNDKIVLEMTPGEALLVLGPIDEACAKAYATYRRLTTTDAPRDERDIACTTAQILDRVSSRLTDLLYPGTSEEAARRLADPLFRAELEAEIELGMC